MFKDYKKTKENEEDKKLIEDFRSFLRKQPKIKATNWKEYRFLKKANGTPMGIRMDIIDGELCIVEDVKKLIIATMSRNDINDIIEP